MFNFYLGMGLKSSAGDISSELFTDLWGELGMYDLFTGKRDNPVKNVTWILEEIPRHFTSPIDGSLSSKLTPNSMTIPCHSSRFYLFSMLNRDMDFG